MMNVDKPWWIIHGNKCKVKHMNYNALSRFCQL